MREEEEEVTKIGRVSKRDCYITWFTAKIAVMMMMMMAVVATYDLLK